MRKECLANRKLPKLLLIIKFYVVDLNWILNSEYLRATCRWVYVLNFSTTKELKIEKFRDALHSCTCVPTIFLVKEYIIRQLLPKLKSAELTTMYGSLQRKNSFSNFNNRHSPRLHRMWLTFRNSFYSTCSMLTDVTKG